MKEDSFRDSKSSWPDHTNTTQAKRDSSLSHVLDELPFIHDACSLTLLAGYCEFILPLSNASLSNTIKQTTRILGKQNLLMMMMIDGKSQKYKYGEILNDRFLEFCVCISQGHKEKVSHLKE